MKTREHTGCVRIENGSILITSTGRMINHLAMLFDTDTGCIHAWGERDSVEHKYKRMISAMETAGMNTKCILFVEFGDMQLTVEERCYILKRCVEHTASGFQLELCQRLITNRDLIEYLRSEMQRVPINLYA